MTTKVCKHCHQLFVADRRNAWHQFYCGKPACRKASKAASQRKWLAKNSDYYRSEAHREYCRLWREKHPRYSIEYHRSHPRKARTRVDAVELVVDGCRQLKQRVLRAKRQLTGGNKDLVPLLDVLSALLTKVEVAVTGM